MSGYSGLGLSGYSGISGYSGTPASGNSYTRTSFTATGGQTSFSVSYSAGYVQVYVNGVLLNAADYTATSGSAVVLATACAAGDIVEFVAYANIVVSSTNANNITGGTAGQVLYQSASSTTAFTSGGSTGQFLTYSGSGAPTWTNALTGSTTAIGLILTNTAEPVTVSATAATGTIALYPSSQSVLYYTTNASANWTINLRFSSGTTMNTAMSTGQAMTVVFMAAQGTTAYYNNVVQVDGATSGVTTKWQNIIPTSGNPSGIDVYSYTIIKTASATFTVLASQTPFR